MLETAAYDLCALNELAFDLNSPCRGELPGQPAVRRSQFRDPPVVRPVAHAVGQPDPVEPAHERLPFALPDLQIALQHIDGQGSRVQLALGGRMRRTRRFELPLEFGNDLFAGASALERDPGTVNLRDSRIPRLRQRRAAAPDRCQLGFQPLHVLTALAQGCRQRGRQSDPAVPVGAFAARAAPSANP